MSRRIFLSDFGSNPIIIHQEHRQPDGTRRITSTSQGYTITPSLVDRKFIHRVGDREQDFVQRFTVQNFATNSYLEVTGNLPSFMSSNVLFPFNIPPESSKEITVVANVNKIKILLLDGNRRRTETLRFNFRFTGNSGPIYIRQ